MHELRLEEVYDINRQVTEVKIVVQEDSSDTYSRLTKKQKSGASGKTLWVHVVLGLCQNSSGLGDYGTERYLGATL